MITRHLNHLSVLAVALLFTVAITACSNGLNEQEPSQQIQRELATSRVAQLVLFQARGLVVSRAATRSAQVQSLNLEIVIPEQVTLGTEIPVELSIANSSAQQEEIVALGSASVHLVLEKILPENQAEVDSEAYLGGNTRVVETKLPDGQTLIRSIAVVQETITLPPEGKTELTIDLGSAFGGRHFDPGTYILSATYEDELITEGAFQISIDPTQTVPTLNNLIEEGNFETKVWARNSLLILTGQPEWSPREDDSKEKVQSEVEKLRSWWESNKSQLKLQDGRFVSK